MDGDEYSCLIMLIRNDSGREALADIKVSGVNLTEGELTGLNHLERWGNADLETKYFFLNS